LNKGAGAREEVKNTEHMYIKRGGNQRIDIFKYTLKNFNIDDYVMSKGLWGLNEANAPAWSDFGEGFLPESEITIFTLYSQMTENREKGEQALLCLLIRALVLFKRVPLS
jgi:hypothetical protein